MDIYTMQTKGIISNARSDFHLYLLNNTYVINDEGIVSNADKDSERSLQVSKLLYDKIIKETNKPNYNPQNRPKAQTSGMEFEKSIFKFLKSTFLELGNIRPGYWNIIHESKNDLKITCYEQYKHLTELDKIISDQPSLAAMIGKNYLISSDIIIARKLYTDEELNKQKIIVDDITCHKASLRSKNHGLPLLHAVISSKWTIRSDRSQNSRTEASSLIKHRKGPLPYIVVVTAEPLPNRIASIALGTGDIDCVYHFALQELNSVFDNLEYHDAKQLLNTMVEGNRLKDISDLPLDLAI
jgi:hypothetical protein